MKKNFNSKFNNINTNIIKIFKFCETNFVFANTKFDKYIKNKNSFKKRLFQKILYSSKLLINLNYLNFSETNNKNLRKKFSNELNLENFIVKSNGEIKIKKLFLFKNFFQFLKYSFILIYKLIITLFFISGNENKKINFFFDKLYRIDEEKKNHYLLGLMVKLTDFDTENDIIICSSNLNKKYKNIIFSKDPILYSIKYNLNFIEKLYLIFEAIIIFFSIFLFFFNNKFIAILYKDVFEILLISKLDEKKLLKNAVFTVSNISDQSLWSRNEDKKFKTIFFWNTISPLVNIKKKNSDFLDHKIYLDYLEYDIEYSSYKNFQFGRQVRIISEDIKTNSNLLIKDNNNKKFELVNNSLNLIVFDTNPKNDLIINKENITHIENLENLKIFLTDIIYIVQAIEKETFIKVKILYKMKGSRSSLRKEYYKFLNEIKKNNKNFIILNDKSNIENLLLLADITISYPYTSIPFENISYLKQNCFFYDPNDFYEEISDSKKMILKNKNEIKKNILKYKG